MVEDDLVITAAGGQCHCCLSYMQSYKIVLCWIFSSLVMENRAQNQKSHSYNGGKIKVCCFGFFFGKLGTACSAVRVNLMKTHEFMRLSIS